ncbi:MAG: hypothetical protein ACTSUO_07295 [Candidatus Thorarchaeota archaeon]
MKNETVWDYSHIPKRTWKWFFVEDHWMDVVVGESGLEYIGTDWTCQSGGGYMGGFQTFDEFFTDKSLQDMPKKIATEIREHLEKHRKEGGASLQLIYVHEVEGFQLTGVFVHLDDTPIHVKRVRKKGKMTIFKGSIKPGKHVFSFVFVLQSANDQKKVDGEVKIEVQKGKNTAILKTSQDNDGTLSTEIVSE